jgi:hypothetical protein
MWVMHVNWLLIKVVFIIYSCLSACVNHVMSYLVQSMWLVNYCAMRQCMAGLRNIVSGVSPPDLMFSFTKTEKAKQHSHMSQMSSKKKPGHSIHYLRGMAFSRARYVTKLTLARFACHFFWCLYDRHIGLQNDRHPNSIMCNKFSQKWY